MTLYKMPKEEFFDRFKPPTYDDDNEATLLSYLEEMLDDPYESLIVLALMKELIRDGKFREPIIANAYDRIDNGCHRLAAYMYSPQITEIEYSDVYPDEAATYFWGYEVKFRCPDVNVDREFYKLLTSLRSFALDERTWVEADCLCGTANKDELSGLWLCPEDRLKDLCDTLQERVLKFFGVFITFISIKKYDEVEDDWTIDLTHLLEEGIK